MSIESPVGTLDIKNATLRVGKLEVSNIQGIDTALNVTRSNSILIYDDQASTTTFGGFTSSPGVRDTVGGYLDVAGGYVYWGQKLPNAWTMEFEMDIRSGTNAGPLYANVFSSTNTGGDGYSFTCNDSNDKITLMYDGVVLTETTVPGLFTASENWQKVVINYERNTISISLNGQRAFYYKDIERETPYTTGEYVNFSSSSTDGRKIRTFKVTNGDKWTYSGESNITYTHGSLGIGVVDPTATLDVAGTVKATTFVGDGSAITNINSGNIGDFASNVERIESLEASNVNIWSNLASNVTRIASLEASNVNIWSNLASNVTRIASLEASNVNIWSNLASNVTRIASLEASNVSIWSNLASNVTRISSLEASNVNIWSNLASNVVRIASLETGDMTISGDKTFSNNVFVTNIKDASNKYLTMVNTDGKLIRSPVYVTGTGKYVITSSEAEFLGNITLSGNTTVVSSNSVTIEDRIFGIGSNNSLTNLDSGIIIEHQDSGVYANVALIHHADEHRFSLGYTQNTFTDDHVLHYDHPDNVVLTVDLRGDVLVQNNLQVGTANLFVDTTTSNVGIGTSTPGYALDVAGDINLSGDFYQGGSIFVSSLWTSGNDSLYYNASNVGIGTNTANYELDVAGNVNATTLLANTAQIHSNLTIGSNVTIDDTASNVISVDGNIKADTFNVGDFLVVAAYGLDHVTNENNSTGDTIISTNPITGFRTLSNVVANGNVTATDLLCNTLTMNLVSFTGLQTFDQVTNVGNITSNTVQFTNTNTSLVTLGNVGIGTTSPGALLELSKDTGSATISPTELRLSTRTNAADWSVTDPWARLSFYTDDVTGDAPGVMASVGAVASSVDGGENTRLAFFTAEPHVERMCIDRYGNVGIGTTAPTESLEVQGNVKIYGNMTYYIDPFKLDRSVLNSLSPTVWAVAGESTARVGGGAISYSSQVTIEYLNGTPMWYMRGRDENVDILNTISSTTNTWTIAIAIAKKPQSKGVLFTQLPSGETSETNHYISWVGSITGDEFGPGGNGWDIGNPVSIPDESVLVVRKNGTGTNGVTVWLNGGIHGTATSPETYTGATSNRIRLGQRGRYAGYVNQTPLHIGFAAVAAWDSALTDNQVADYLNYQSITAY